MVVNDVNVISEKKSNLIDIKISDNGVIKITVKNGDTLELVPEIEEGKVINYKKEYLTGKENKEIEKINKKIEEMKQQISKLKDSSTEEKEENSSEEINENENKEIIEE